MTTLNKCRTCQWFDQKGAIDSIGICVRYPPKPFPTGPKQTISIWPSVQPGQSCGEFKLEIITAAMIPEVGVMNQ